MASSPDVTSQAVTLGTSLAATGVIAFPARGGTIHIPASSPITSLTFYKSEKVGGTFKPLMTAQSPPVAVAITGIAAGATGVAVDLPSQCFGGPELKIVANAAGPVVLSLCG